MERSPNAPSEDQIKEYRRQVDFLSSVLKTSKCEETLESSATAQLIPRVPATTPDDVINEQIRERLQAQTTQTMREELLGTNTRQRKGLNNLVAENLENELAVEEQRREKIIEDMIAMTREWKEQSKIANKVIRKDVDQVETSSKLADSNHSKLKVESDRLQEFNRRACNCWIWIMIVVLCWAFISMVFIIRIT